MGRGLGDDAITKAILKGAKSAAEAYDHLSGGHWLDAAPESFIQASIAFAFADLKHGGTPFDLTLEASHTKIAWDYDLKRRATTNAMTHRQRFDMLLWEASGRPTIPIEIKKAYSPNACTIDAQRIRQWVRSRTLPMKRGYIVAYSSAEGPNSKGKIRNLFNGIKLMTKASELKSIYETSEHYPDDAWGVACFTIT